jgi:hypothetical protein
VLATPGHLGGFLHVTSDKRRPVVGELFVRGARDDEGAGRSLSLSPTLTGRFGAGTQLSIAPSLSWWRNPQQYVAAADAGGESHYVVGDLLQSSLGLTLRASYAFSSRLSLQLYAQPFVSAGEYRRLGEVDNPRAQRLGERIQLFASDSIHRASDQLAIGTNAGTLHFTRPDYSLAELRSNAVMRWEYRPGSTLFVVWSQGRTLDGEPSPFDVSGQSRELFRAPSTNVLLVKLSHWMGR